MTAQKYLDSRAKAVWDTWAPHIPGKISFFTSEDSKSIYPIPIVSLPGVDDTYPPQKKSFLMFKFMHDNYIDKFEFFMRVDDDVYLKPERIVPFLRALNSTKRQFIGQPGTGNKDEFGLLSLDYGENFCMGGPGIIMTRHTLKLLVPNIRYCLKNLYSTHEDVEIGRCVRRFTGTPCTWSYEMQYLFYHNASGSDSFTGELLVPEVFRPISLHPIKNPKYLYRMHNFLNVQRALQLRQRYLNLERDKFNLEYQLNEYKTTLKRDFKPDLFTLKPSYERKTRLKFYSDFRDSIVPTVRSHEIIYEYFTRSIFSPVNEAIKRGHEGYWKNSLSEVIRQLTEILNKDSKANNAVYDFQKIIYGYMRHHPLTGLDYILHSYLIKREYIGKKYAEAIKTHFYIKQTYTDLIFRIDNNFDSIFYRTEGDPVEIQRRAAEESRGKQNRSDSGILDSMKKIIYGNKNSDSHKVKLLESIPYIDLPHKDRILDTITDIQYTPTPIDYTIDPIHNKHIHFIVPLIGRFEPFKRFIKNFENVCLRNNENVEIAVVLFWNREADVKNNHEIRAIMQNLKQKYLHNHLHLIETDRNFSRSIGREIGAALFSSDSLLCFLDVDVIFTREFLLRARLHAIKGKQAYFPIVYSEFEPNPDILIKIYKKNRTLVGDHFSGLSLDGGYWRSVGFGNIATYKSDFQNSGGFDTSIHGWGKEDVDIYAKFSKSGINVIRAADNGLVHVFHIIKCDEEELPEDQKIMCYGTKYNTIASKFEIARIVHETGVYKIPKIPKMILTKNSTNTTYAVSVFKPKADTSTSTSTQVAISISIKNVINTTLSSTTAVRLTDTSNFTNQFFQKIYEKPTTTKTLYNFLYMVFKHKNKTKSRLSYQLTINMTNTIFSPNNNLTNSTSPLLVNNINASNLTNPTRSPTSFLENLNNLTSPSVSYTNSTYYLNISSIYTYNTTKILPRTHLRLSPNQMKSIFEKYFIF